MRRQVRNDPDRGPADDGAVVTYSRLSSRGGRGPAERQEPFLDAREVPYTDRDLRAYDPERAEAGGLDEAIDDLEAPRRGRGGRRRGARGAVLVGAVALAAGMVILAYAYGIATRGGAPEPSSAGASAALPGSAGDTRGTLSADDPARSIPASGEAPAPAAPVGDRAAVPLPAEPATAAAKPPEPKTRPEKSASVPAAASSGAGGVPMDGDAAQPALVAPVPATTTPAAPVEAAPPRATANAEPPPAKAADAKAADSKAADNKQAGSGDDLMANIERLLKRDGATAGTSGQPGAAPAAIAGPTPIVPAQPTPVSDPNALPQLPDPNTTAATQPPAAPPPVDNRLIPPADIPNVAPTETGTSGSQ